MLMRSRRTNEILRRKRMINVKRKKKRPSPRPDQAVQWKRRWRALSSLCPGRQPEPGRGGDWEQHSAKALPSLDFSCQDLTPLPRSLIQTFHPHLYPHSPSLQMWEEVEKGKPENRRGIWRIYFQENIKNNILFINKWLIDWLIDVIIFTTF